METKQRFITMFIALVAMFMGTKVMAQEAYAVLSDDSKTLTFRYDSSKSSYGDKAYDLNEGNNLPGWNGITTVETVVFEESFATFRPVSTRPWFDCFEDLTEIVGMEYLNTSEVTTMNSMFGGCKSITNLDLSHFNTSKVTNMEAMFITCHKLKEINLRGFDTSNVTSMQIMFLGCVALETLNLESFNTSSATSMAMMFSGCRMLRTIYVGDGWSVANASCFGMFTQCENLTGGEGTTYDDNHTAAEYARIDGGTSNPGYLTGLTYNLKLAGVRVTAANQNNVLGNGIFTYVPSSKTLKVKGSYSSSLDAPLIESSIDGLIIDVMQDAELEASSTHGNQVFWLKDGTTTMKGKGKLTLKSLYETGIYLTNSASVVIDNMNMVIDAYWGIAGPPSGQKQEKLTIKSSNIVITTGSSTSNDLAAICDLRGGIILQDCSITSPNGYNISNGSVYNNGNLAKEVTITSKGGISTDIDAIDNGQLTIDKSLPLYNLNGQRVSHPVKGQIYIQNGRKVKF